jgi:hypothetical protein
MLLAGNLSFFAEMLNVKPSPVFADVSICELSPARFLPLYLALPRRALSTKTVREPGPVAVATLLSINLHS